MKPGTRLAFGILGGIVISLSVIGLALALPEPSQTPISDQGTLIRFIPVQATPPATPLPPTNSPKPTNTALPRPTLTPESQLVYRTVQPGEALNSVAQRFNTTPDELKRLNNLRTDVIPLGTTKLLVPVTVQPPAATPTRVMSPTPTTTPTVTPLFTPSATATVSAVKPASLDIVIRAAWQMKVWPGEDNHVTVHLVQPENGDNSLTVLAQQNSTIVNPAATYPLRTPTQDPFNNPSNGALRKGISLTAPPNAHGTCFVQAMRGDRIVAHSNSAEFYNGQKLVLPVEWNLYIPSPQAGELDDFQLKLYVQWDSSTGTRSPNLTEPQAAWTSPMLGSQVQPVPRQVPIALGFAGLPVGLVLLGAASLRRRAPSSAPAVEQQSESLPRDTLARAYARWRNHAPDQPLQVDKQEVLQIAIRTTDIAQTIASAAIDFGTTEAVQLRIVVHAEQMAVEPRVQMLDVPESRNSEWIEFGITPQRVGTWTIQIEFFYQLNWLQTIAFTVEVVGA